MRDHFENGRILGLVAIVAASLGSAAPAHGEDQPRLPEEKVVVMIATRDFEAEAEPLIRAVQGQLSDLPVFFQVTWERTLARAREEREAVAAAVARATGAAAVFWCDFANPDRVYVFINLPDGGRVVERLLDGSGPGGVNETLGLIVRAAIVAVLQRAGSEARTVSEPQTARPEAGAAPAPPAEPPAGDEKREEPVPAAKGETPPAAAPMDDQRQSRLVLEADYAIGIVSTENPVTHGFLAAAHGRVAKDWYVFASYTVVAPITTTQSGVRLEIDRHPVWLGARFERDFDRIEIGVLAAVVVDYQTDTARAEDSGMQASGDGFELEVAFAPFLRFGVHLFADVRLVVGLGAEIALNRARYLIETNDGNEVAFAWWVVRPMGLVGFSAGFLP